VLTYGATARRSEFDLSIAPRGNQRVEYGGFLQDEMLFGPVRWVLGARWDNIDPIGSVYSPRTALLYSPMPNHTLRVSFSRAFRAPSVINTDLDTTILSEVMLPTGSFAFATSATGNSALKEERMDAYEAGYTGTLRGHAVVSVSVYQNTTRQLIDFYAPTFYSAAAPPPNWPLPLQFLDAPPLRNSLPSTFSYRNVGTTANRGLELAVNARPSTQWSWFANYSYQDDPVVTGVSADEINAPPTDRVNAGASWDRGRFFLHATAHYQSKATWRDVLDARYWGPTASFRSINAGAGFRMSNNIVLSLTSTNLTNEQIQQHVFGDIISRKVTAQVRLRYP
jgi:outer membrane receptor protein involved in Fe transport